MPLTSIAAFICVLCRSILSICDKKIFKQESNNFIRNLSLNTIIPFLIAFLMSYLFAEKNIYFGQFLFSPGIIFSALGSQITAYVTSAAFQKMSVKSVLVSSKFADLFIPLSVFVITEQFDVYKFLFSTLTTLIFIPILYSLLRQKINFGYADCLKLICAVVLQACINSYFEMSAFTSTWAKFLTMMSCILFWRSLLVLIPLVLQLLREHQSEILDGKNIQYFPLFFRSILGFISSAAFFYSISKETSTVAWPILNSGPLITTFAAHFFLKENILILDMLVLSAFCITLLLYSFLLI